MKLITLLPALCIALQFACAPLVKGAAIPVLDPTFSGNAGSLAGVVDLNALNAAPTSITTQLGTSPWYVTAEASPLLSLGFRAAADVNVTTPGAASIRYDLGVSLGGLLGVELPETSLWQPLTGSVLQANTNYRLTADVNAGSGLSLSVLSDLGLGMAITTGASSVSMGNFAYDTLSSPGLLTLISLGGSTQQLVLDFTTGSNPVGGTMGVVLFAGRGSQLLTAGAPNFVFDNVQLGATPQPVPELSVTLCAALGCALVTNGRIRRFRQPCLG